MKTAIALAHFRESFRVIRLPHVAWFRWNWHPHFGGHGGGDSAPLIMGAVVAIVLISFLALRGSDSK